jgi:hypothetical protein
MAPIASSAAARLLFFIASRYAAKRLEARALCSGVKANAEGLRKLDSKQTLNAMKLGRVRKNLMGYGSPSGS